ncbi:MAG TPA: aldehyde dehydrogenase family protein, partial [Magnetospirillum sp.]|nr:aldehyde dehydrogenase family protein [Magnetospirillum sp.]
AESWENGKPVRETLGADIPLVVDHFRYYAGWASKLEGTTIPVSHPNQFVYTLREPMGVVGLIIPWNFPLLMAAWKLAPALAAGNAVVIKPAEQTPLSLLLLTELIADVVPPGVLNVITGFGPEAGAPLASSTRVDKVAFTGETSTGRLILQYTAPNIIPVTLELGGKSPNIFFPDILAADDGLLDKALEAFASFALNQGEVCTAPSRVLVHDSIFDQFIERAVARVRTIRQGNPLDFATQIGAQTSQEQLDKILSYVEVGKKEGAQLLTGGARAEIPGLEKGFYVQPTVFVGDNKQQIFQQEIFGPVVSVTRFSTLEEALAIANDSPFGLAAAVWSRDGNTAYRAARGLEAGRVWVNAYHLYPAHTAFGGYKHSGLGRENHKLALEHYQQVKAVVTSYSTSALGFF